MISVIIPTARRPSLLIRAVNSVLAQTVRDLEVVVIIDGPDSETLRALNDVADSRLRFIQNARSVGSAEARNVGIRAAHGEWVAFLDDDDEWLENKLELQLAAAGSSDHFIIVSCLSYVATPLQRYIWPRRIYDNAAPLAEYLFDRRSWFRGDAMLQCSSLLMQRRLCLELMFTPQHDDWDMLLRAKAKDVKIITVGKPLVVHNTEDGRDSLGASFDWRTSLLWADNNRSLIDRRAYAGFCLTIISPQAAKARDYSAFVVLLYRALRYGHPRPIQLMLHFVIWVVPMHRRQKFRSVWYNPLKSYSRLAP